MTASIIQFPTAPKKRRAANVAATVAAAPPVDISDMDCAEKPGRSSLERRSSADEAKAASCRNSHLRRERYDAWLAVAAVKDYWRARIKLASALQGLQRHGAEDLHDHPVQTEDGRMFCVNQYRIALSKLLLMPAHNQASVIWKRACLKAGNYLYGGCLSKARLEHAIAEDVAFLAAHPVRRAKGGIFEGSTEP